MDTFNNNLRIHAFQEQEKLMSMEENPNADLTDQLSNEMVVMMEDKDILTSHLDASKEYVEQKIGERESEILRAIADEWRATEQKMQEEQH